IVSVVSSVKAPQSTRKAITPHSVQSRKRCERGRPRSGAAAPIGSEEGGVRTDITAPRRGEGGTPPAGGVTRQSHTAGDSRSLLSPVDLGDGAFDLVAILQIGGAGLAGLEVALRLGIDAIGQGDVAD